MYVPVGPPAVNNWLIPGGTTFCGGLTGGGGGGPWIGSSGGVVAVVEETYADSVEVSPRSQIRTSSMSPENWVFSVRPSLLAFDPAAKSPIHRSLLMLRPYPIAPFAGVLPTSVPST